MQYLCTDRGTSRCPCLLLPAGQCYTCTMIKEERCSCEEKAGWQGVCPYTEYLQQGETLRGGMQDMQIFPVRSLIVYGKDLYGVTLEMPAGMAQQCRCPGTYVMAETLGWRMPLSVLRVRHTGAEGAVEFLIKNTGPKSSELIRQASQPEPVWKAAGPYHSGLLHTETRALLEEPPGMIIARGMAAVPLFHYLDESEYRDFRLFLDETGLPKSVMDTYCRDADFVPVSLEDANHLHILQHMVTEAAGRERIALFVSPYFAEELCRDMTSAQKEMVVRPNPANLCCGEGICGACSHTDRDGVTVRLCKCGETMVE